MAERQLVLFMDSGDTVVDESTEMRDTPGGVVQSFAFHEGAREGLLALRDAGYTLALVADGLQASFDRMYNEHHFPGGIFAARAISETVGAPKPSPKMFQAAFDALGLQRADARRVIMVGNNVTRDIAGANRFGIRSVLMTWSPRYPMTPKRDDERPTYRVGSFPELLALVDRLEQALTAPESHPD